MDYSNPPSVGTSGPPWSGTGIVSGKNFIMRLLLLLLIPGWLAAEAAPQAAPDDPAAAEFFEKKIRPVLVDRCHSCHSASATKLKGGLRLDSLESALKGGDTGPAIVPGNPEKSLLVEAGRHVVCVFAVVIPMHVEAGRAHGGSHATRQR